MKTIQSYFTVEKIITNLICILFLFVINLFVHILLFNIYLSFLVIINSILSACDSLVGRGCGPWERVLPPQLEEILEETLYIYISILIKLLNIYIIKQEKYIIYLLAGQAKTHLNKHQNPLYTNLANLECPEDHRDA